MSYKDVICKKKPCNKFWRVVKFNFDEGYEISCEPSTDRDATDAVSKQALLDEVKPPLYSRCI